MTVRKAPLITAALVCIVPAIIIGTPVAYVPLAFLLVFCALSVLYALLAASLTRLDATPPELTRFERESSSSCTVTIRNTGVLMLPCVVVTLSIVSVDGFAPITSEHIIALRPRERLTLTLPVRFPHIGRYELKVSRLRFYGPFGVLSIGVRPRWSAPVHVTPKLYDMPRLNLYTLQAVMAVDFNTPEKLGGGEYSDVRQYEPGDPLKNIHWNLSAHSNDYITRLFKTDAVSGVSVYVDLRLPQDLRESAADINDRAAECAYSAATRALAQGYHVELVYTQSNTPFTERPKDYTRLMETMYSLPPVSAKEGFPIEQLIAERSGGYLSPDNIVVITACADERLIAVLRDLRQRGKRVTLCRIDGDDPVRRLEEIA